MRYVEYSEGTTVRHLERGDEEREIGKTLK
jgi:hypothetical protein